MKNLKDYTEAEMKPYRVYYSSYGIDCGHFQDVRVPNKTFARMIVQGELNRGCKVLKIILKEVK